MPETPPSGEPPEGRKRPYRDGRVELGPPEFDVLGDPYDETESEADGSDGDDEADEYVPRRRRRRRKVAVEDEPAEHELGPRRAALSARRRARRRRRVVAGAAAVVFAATAVGVAAGVRYLGRDESGTEAGDAAPQPGEPIDHISSTLLFAAAKKGAPASFLTLLSVDRAADRANVVYIPATIAVEVPGRGLQGLGDALASGGPSLLQVAAQNLLGVEIDHYASFTAGELEGIFSALGPLTVEVPSEVRVRAGRDRARLAFSAGTSRLSAPQLTELLFTVGLDGDQVELGSRHLAFWDALLDAFHEDPDGLRRRAEGVVAAFEGVDAPGEFARVLEGLAAIDPARRTLAILPVRQVSVGGDELFAADPAEVEAFLERTVGESVGADLVSVQILNGNGVPGIGQQVAERLVGEGFRVALTGNAPRLDYRRTLIVTYDRTPAGLEAARRAKLLIGVGRIQVSGQEQGSVELTVVIGKDFLVKTNSS